MISKIMVRDSTKLKLSRHGEGPFLSKNMSGPPAVNSLRSFHARGYEQPVSPPERQDHENGLCPVWVVVEIRTKGIVAQLRTLDASKYIEEPVLYAFRGCSCVVLVRS